MTHKNYNWLRLKMPHRQQIQCAINDANENVICDGNFYEQNAKILTVQIIYLTMHFCKYLQIQLQLECHQKLKR